MVYWVFVQTAHFEAGTQYELQFHVAGPWVLTQGHIKEHKQYLTQGPDSLSSDPNRNLTGTQTKEQKVNSKIITWNNT